MIYPAIIINYQCVLAKAFAPPTGHGVIYEVIRVTDGVFLFLEDHVQRLKKSAQLANANLVCSLSEVTRLLTQLVKMNAVTTGNIRLDYYFHKGKITYQAAYFVQHRYPTEDEYCEGVRTSLHIAERTIPNAKIWQPALREEIKRIIAKKNLYEVILVHPDGYITEGSRTNVFMVSAGTVYTAPEADVLPGVTRKYVLQACSELSVPVVEKRMKVDRIFDMEALFFSGTSPKVLPVAFVDDFLFDAYNTIVRQIMKKFDEISDKKN